MIDSTEKMAALDWSLPAEATDEEIQIDLEADGSDGAVWEWNGTAWVPVMP